MRIHSQHICSVTHFCLFFSCPFRKFHKVSGNCCEFLCLEGDMTTGFKFFNKTILTKGEKFSSLSTSNLGKKTAYLSICCEILSTKTSFHFFILN